MTSRQSNQFPIPEGFPEILHNFAKEIVRYQPNDIYDFSIQYFHCLENEIPLNYTPGASSNIHHQEDNTYLEEEWLFEAISETYIPLLQRFQKLVDDKVDFRFTMSLTPPLLNMLDNKLLQDRYIKYL
jgi:hypothetical protein